MSKRLNLRFIGRIVEATGFPTPAFLRWQDGLEVAVKTTEVTISEQSNFAPVSAPFFMPGSASLAPVPVTLAQPTDLAPVFVNPDAADPLPPV